jgi:hypothetical protein|tara:strand:- start:482 stop:1108 length:627 start_codon:yes stop_codon:yes gene_type:complete
VIPRLLARPWAAIAAALVLPATRADAHSFGAGTDTFEAFVEGFNAVLFSPFSLLPCLSLGLLLTLWHLEGMVKAWPYLIASHVVGFGIAPAVGTWVIPALVGAGCVTGAVAAVLPHPSRPVALALNTTVGLLTMLVSLEGHQWFELSLPIYLGIFAAASFAVAAGAGVARLVIERVPHPWVRIAIRIAASWLAAMQMLMIAFLIAPST